MTGIPTEGGAIILNFDGLEETIVMRVDEATPPSKVAWSCRRHNGHPEWDGTRIVFELSDAEKGCLLSFRHEGLVPALDCYLVCESGWDRFLASLAEYVEDGGGNPYRG